MDIEEEEMMVNGNKYCFLLQGQSNEILIPFFFTYIGRPRPEYEELLIKNFFRNPQDVITNKAFFTR